MKKLKEINLIDNKNLTIKLNVIGMVLVVLFYFFLEWLISFLTNESSIGWTEHSTLLVLAGIFGSLIVHELIHGLFYKLFNPDGKVKFGFSFLVVYANSIGSIYTRNQFLWIAVSPFIFVTTILILLFLGTDWLNQGLFILLTSIHTASCIGDFYYVWLLSKYSSDEIMVEDTLEGMTFYEKE